MSNKKMATLTEEAESKMIRALNSAYNVLTGPCIAKMIVEGAVVKQIIDAIEFFQAEKQAMADEAEWNKTRF